MKKKETCFDCLHCKVSAKSTEKHTLCFCAKAKKKENRKTSYWNDKKPCEDFEDMG